MSSSIVTVAGCNVITVNVPDNEIRRNAIALTKLLASASYTKPKTKKRRDRERK